VKTDFLSLWAQQFVKTWKQCCSRCRT